MDGEVWITVPSMPTHEVSSHGRVRARSFRAALNNGAMRWYHGKARFGYWDERHLRFTMTHKGHSFKVHRLVCEAFNGPPPAPNAVCMHLDENSRNNRPENLAWGTQKENLNAPRYRKDASSQWRGRVKKKLSPTDIPTIRERHHAGESLIAIAKDYGVAPCTLSNRLAGRGCGASA